MLRVVRVGLICTALMLVASAVMAQETGGAAATGAGAAATAGRGLGLNFGPAFGAGLVIIGAALGIGRIGGQAVEGMSRQPEAAGNIQTAMIISAALIEGATFFALIVCMLFNWPPV